jgi:hypothetical protein
MFSLESRLLEGKEIPSGYIHLNRDSVQAYARA